MVDKKNKFVLFGLVFFLLALSFVQADVAYQLQWDDSNIDYGVITKSFDLIVSNSNEDTLSLDLDDTLTLESRTTGVDTYTWIIGPISGDRTFTLGNDTFTIEVKSEVEELLDSVDPVTLWVYQEYSTTQIESLDISGTTNEYINFDLDEFSGRFSLQNILNGIELNVTFESGASYPTYYDLSLTSRAYTIADDIVIFNQDSLSYDSVDDILDDNTLINELIDVYDLTGDYTISVNAYKNGNDYKFRAEKGYGNLNSSTLDQVRDLIEEGVNLVNPTSINNDYLVPYFDFSDHLDEITWDTSVDLSSLELVDGTYSIPVTLTDQHSNEITETVTVILEIESNEEQVVVNNTYTPTNEEIIEFIQEITGLPEGETITVTLFGSTLPETFVATVAPAEVEDSIS